MLGGTNNFIVTYQFMCDNDLYNILNETKNSTEDE